MESRRVELIFRLPDNQSLTFITRYSSLLDPRAWQSMIRNITEDIRRNASIDLSRFQRDLCDFSRRANEPSFVDPEAVVVRIVLWVIPYGGIDADFDGGDDDDDADDEVIDEGIVDFYSVSDGVVEQPAELYYLVDESIGGLESAALNQAIELSFRESQDQVRSFGGPPASREALRNLNFFTVEESDQGAAGALCTVCLEEMQQGERVCRMPCSHLFHGGCLARWLEMSSRCPLCRFML